MHGLRHAPTTYWLLGSFLAVVVAFSAGGVHQHSQRLFHLQPTLLRCTRLALGSTFLATAIPSGGWAGAPIFMSEAVRTSDAPAADSAQRSKPQPLSSSTVSSNCGCRLESARFP
jgi:hypothetical protein